MISLFQGNDRSIAGVLINSGHILGKFTSTSIFVPLNSVKWLNQNFFKDNPRTTPLISNQGYVLFISIILLIFMAYLAIAVPERSSTHKLGSYKSAILAIPQVLKNTAVATFVVYLLLIRVIPGLLSEGLMLKFIQNGVAKTTIVNIETILLPYNLFMIFLIGWFIKRFMIERLMLFSFLMKNINVVFLIVKFIMLAAYIRGLKQSGFDADLDYKSNSKV